MLGRGDLWRRPDFMRLWSAQAISELGARFAREGLPLAAILTLGASPGEVGALAALTTAPSILVGLFVGDYIDHARQRRVMIGADMVRAAVLASVPLAAVFHLLSLPQIFVVGALVGSASVMFDAANRAYLPRLADARHLVEANTKLSVTASVANVGGPALSGLLIQLLGAPIAVGMTAISYLSSAGLLWRIGERRQESTRGSSPRLGWREGLRSGTALIASHPPMKAVLFMEMTAGLFVSMFGALYPFIALKELHLTPAMFGLTFAIGGVGALAGAAVHPWVSRVLGYGKAAVFSALLAGAVSFAIPLTHASPWIALIVLCVAQFLGDAFTTVSAITVNSLRQTLFAQGELGRVGAVYLALGGAAAMTGGLASGLLGQVLGPRTAMLIASAGLTVSIGWGLFSPLRTLDDLPPGPDVDADGSGLADQPPPTRL